MVGKTSPLTTATTTTSPPPLTIITATTKTPTTAIAAASAAATTTHPAHSGYHQSAMRILGPAGNEKHSPVSGSTVEPLISVFLEGLKNLRIMRGLH